MSQTHHWNYFNAIEEDVQRLSRYVDLSNSNFGTHSIEISRLLMAATQDLDVIFKQICAHHNQLAENEQSYRQFLPGVYPKLLTVKVTLPAYDLDFTPMISWASNDTPTWWTANNKVKHERHIHFSSASVENMLNAVAALFIGNIFFHHTLGLLDTIGQGSRICYSDDLVASISPTAFGMTPNYKLP